MENISQIIKAYNKQVTRTIKRSIAPYNCRNKKEYLMNRNCRVGSVVYKYVVSVTELSKEYAYVGVPEVDWK